MLKEGKNIEFKREYIDDIKYTVLAFANTDGGKLYIGVNDDGTICGVNDTNETSLRLSNMIRDIIRPDVTLFTDISIEKIENKDVLVLTVQRGTARPYYLHSKGVRSEGVYVRQGASSVPASETAILQMIKETSGDCYEEARSLNQDLTFKKTETYFKKNKLDFEEAQKKTLKLISEDGTYSNLALLLSDQCTHSIKMAVFEGSTKNIFQDRKELSGSLLQQLDEAYSFIDLCNHTRSDFEGLYRIDTRDYPEEALREALLNAIVHRDYSVSGSTLISLFDDRIEFVTIGGLVRGISYDDIMLGVSALRNKNLANVFYRLKLIEAYGTGIMKIKNAYLEQSVHPIFEVSNNAFKITLPNINFKKDNKIENDNIKNPDNRINDVLALFSKQAFITRKDVDDALEISQTTSGILLKEMVNAGLLEKIGDGRAVKYIKR